MNNSTEADDVGLDHLLTNNWSGFLIAMIFLSFALTSSLFSLCFLNTYLKKLHHVLKMILAVLSGYNFICCTLSAMFLIYFRSRGRAILNHEWKYTNNRLEIYFSIPNLMIDLFAFYLHFIADFFVSCASLFWLRGHGIFWSKTQQNHQIRDEKIWNSYTFICELK